MKQEPELIDIFALVAMHSFLSNAPRIGLSPAHVAWEAYKQAEEMMKVREDFINEGDSDV